MATIDLGRLGFVNKGTYNNSTTYEKNDLVQFTDGGILSTYLYIDSTAQSGQAPSSSGTAGSRWVFFAKGVTDTLGSISNNNIVVKDNSGNITGLSGNNKIITTNNSGVPTAVSIGSAGQAFKVNSGANGFEFGTIQSDFVKLATTTVSSGVGYIDVDNVFNQSGYNSFQIDIKQLQPASADSLYFRFLNNSDGSEYSTGNYRWAVTGQEASSGGQNDGQQDHQWNTSNVKIAGTGGSLNPDADARGSFMCKMFIYSPHDSFRTGFHWLDSYLRNGNDNHMNMRGSGHVNVNDQFRGFRLVMGSGNINKAVVTTYGIKE